MSQIDLIGRMGIRVYAHQTSGVERVAMPAPVQIEPPGIGVDLNGYAVFRTSSENRLNVDVISGSAQQLPAGHMAEYRGMGIGYGASNALRLCGPVELETPMHARDDKVEAGKNLVGIIERAVRQDVGLDPFEDSESRPIPFVETVNIEIGALQRYGYFAAPKQGWRTWRWGSEITGTARIEWNGTQLQI